MKERFLLAVSWVTFAVVLFVLSTLAVETARAITELPIGGLHEILLAIAQGATNRNEWLLIVSPPVVWLTLWIVTGSPRILPWRK